jgi:hypothetical protein
MSIDAVFLAIQLKDLDMLKKELIKKPQFKHTQQGRDFSIGFGSRN